MPAAPNSNPTYARTPTGFVLVLHPGADVLHELAQLAIREKIAGASFTGFGFGHPTFGFWDPVRKEYDHKAFRDLEMASLMGSIAWQDDRPAR